MKLNSAFPFYSKTDIKQFISIAQEILSGKEKFFNSKQTIKFQKKFSNLHCGYYAIATNSGTSALNTILKNLKLSLRDEIILPAQTCFSNLTSIINSGGKAIICDTNSYFSATFNNIIARVTNQTKAIILVHYLGLINSDIFKIRHFCLKNNIFLIEDCAHSLNAIAFNPITNSYHKAGTIGDASIFSFFPTKIISTGGGV